MAISCGLITECVGDFYGIAPRELLSPRRARHLLLPRHVMFFLGRKLTGKSYPELASLFGGRDHTTVMHGCNGVSALIDEHPVMSREVADIETIIRAADGALIGLSIDFPDNHDPEAIADRLLNAPLARLRISLDELRTLATAVLNRRQDSEPIITPMTYPDLLAAPVRETLKAFITWKTDRFTRGEAVATAMLERSLSALKTSYENKETMQ